MENKMVINGLFNIVLSVLMTLFVSYCLYCLNVIKKMVINGTLKSTHTIPSIKVMIAMFIQ